jgi:hypothetical protein
MGPLAIYLLLLIGLALWRGAVRFGDPVPRIGDPRPESIEYVRAVAQFYQSAKLAREALDVTFADFRRRLAGALRLDGLADLSEVARRYEARTGRAGQEAREVLIRVEAALAAPALDEAKAVELCARLARLDQDLHRPARDRGA